MKEKILELRKLGKSYREITKELGCSKTLVAYYLNSTTKSKSLSRQRNTRKQYIRDIKTIHGGKCKICGYDKCLQALDFHHIFPENKTEGVNVLLTTKSFKEALKEAEKCLLVCSNCHREIHAGVISF